MLSEQAKYLQKERKDKRQQEEQHVGNWPVMVWVARARAPRFLNDIVPWSQIQITISAIWMNPSTTSKESKGRLSVFNYSLRPHTQLPQYTAYSYRPVDEELEDDEEGHHFFLSLGPMYAKLFVGPADRIPLRDWLNVGRRTMSWMLRSTTSLNSWSLTIFCHNRFSSVIVVWSTTPSTSPVLDLTTFHFLS